MFLLLVIAIILCYDQTENIKIFKAKYKIEKQKSKGYDFYNYRVYRKTFIFWSYQFFSCGKDGNEEAQKWIKDDKENRSSEVVYNE